MFEHSRADDRWARVLWLAASDDDDYDDINTFSAIRKHDDDDDDDNSVTEHTLFNCLCPCFSLCAAVDTLHHDDYEDRDENVKWSL